MYHLMVLMVTSLRGYLLETHWDLLMVKCLDLMKASNWDILIVKCLALYLQNVDGITLGTDVGTELGSLDGYFGGSSGGNLEGLLL